jgi:hypothetical protein
MSEHEIAAEPRSLGTLEKALRLNLDRGIYGTFAEIGAGQDTANWFFRAGGASGTVAKTMSAYDMKFSDEIYGRAGRYVSRPRLEAMLDHEFGILRERLEEQRGGESRFFVLANTVRARGFMDTDQECHGWVGVRFQEAPFAPPSDVLLHVRLLDATNREQTEALGILGVNLVWAAYHQRQTFRDLLGSLMDGLNRWRVEIDMVKCRGPAFPRPLFDDRLGALEMIQTGLTDAALFLASGEIVQASDTLYKRPVLVKRGRFDPVTNLNLDMLERGGRCFREDFGGEADGCLELLEMTMNNLNEGASGVCAENFLARADVLQALGKNVLLSKYPEFHRLSGFLARHTRMPVGIVLGLPLFEELFKPHWYADLAGGVIESFGRLFRNQVRLYVYPSGDPSTGRVITADQARLDKTNQHLLRYFLETGCVRPIPDGLLECLFVTGDEIRRMIAAGDPRWRQFVPEVANPDCGSPVGAG